MRINLKFKKVTAAALCPVLFFMLLSCDREPVEERPELPPLESMVMDFSDFENAPAGMKGTLETYQNFWYSFITVGICNAYAAVASLLPVAAYSYALQQTPVYVGDHTWEWSFDFPLNNVNYTATLTGARISNEEFSMEMVIALAVAPNAGVKWFDGVVRYDHTHAVWTLYRNGTIGVLEIEWNKDFESGEADLTYTISDEEYEQYGSYIRWEYRPGEFYDAAYTVSLVEGITYIEWNTATLEGRVKAPVNFGNEDWHCWDSNANGLVDKECG